MWTNEIDHPGKDHYYGEGVWAISKNIPAEQELNEKKYCPDPVFDKKIILQAISTKISHAQLKGAKQFHAPENHLTPYPSKNNGQSLNQLKKFSYGSTGV